MPMMEKDVQPSFGLAIDDGQQRGHALGFQHISLQRHTDGVYSVISPFLRIWLREAKLPRRTQGDGQVSRIEQHELSMAPHQLGGLVPSTEDWTFDPSFGIGWQEVLRWYRMEQVRQLDTSMVTFQQSPWITKGTRGARFLVGSRWNFPSHHRVNNW